MLCYNASNFIEQCLSSVLTQEHTLRVQLVVLDDASSDHSFERIQSSLKLLDSSDVIAIQNQENLGCYHNLEKGLSLCQGKYIAYLEGDDFWLSTTKLQDQFNHLESNKGLSGIGGRCIFIDEAGNQTEQKYYTEVEDKTWTNSDFWVYPPFQASSFMFRNTLRLPHSIDKLCCNDKLLYVLASAQGDIYYHSGLTTAYRYHKENVSHRVDLKTVYREHVKTNTLLLNHLGMRYAVWYLLGLLKMTYMRFRTSGQ